MIDRRERERLRLRKKRANPAYLKRERESHRVNEQIIRVERRKLGLCPHCGEKPPLNRKECGMCSGSRRPT
jgi:RNA polymerase-binding transcription factor DksA